MWFTSKQKTMPSRDEALPGRAQRTRVPERHAVSGHPLAPPYPEGLEMATFGLGCFWGAERMFWSLPGVWTTAVGYAGGYTPNPTYEEVCSGRTGHTEAVLVVFDPKRVSYEQLLKVFWESHDPTQGMRQGNDVGTQYRSAIYVHSPEQRRLAEASRRLPKGTCASGLRSNRYRDRRSRRVLLRRGLPSAVPGEEPGRLLRSGRHRRRLSLRDRRRRIGSNAR